MSDNGSDNSANRLQFGQIGVGGATLSEQCAPVERPTTDTTLTKVFVGGLSWETTSEELFHHFKVYGDILEAIVIADRESGTSRGYGFITFCDPQSAMIATNNPSPIIRSRKANCHLAVLGSRKNGIRHRGSLYQLHNYLYYAHMAANQMVIPQYPPMWIGPSPTMGPDQWIISEDDRIEEIDSSDQYDIMETNDDHHEDEQKMCCGTTQQHVHINGTTFYGPRLCDGAKNPSENEHHKRLVHEYPHVDASDSN